MLLYEILEEGISYAGSSCVETPVNLSKAQLEKLVRISAESIASSEQHHPIKESFVKSIC